MCTQHGFSLIELMIGLALSAVVSLGMYNTFVQQQRVATRQEHITEVNQTVRLSMDAMLTELRGAGFDPDGIASAGILEADGLHVRFTRDLNCNGSIAQSSAATPNLGVLDRNDEDVAYTVDPQRQELQRTVFPNGGPGIPQPVASNIVAGGFCYFLAADLTTCVANPARPFSDIRMVQITLTARASAPDPQYINRKVPANSPFRHYHQATLTSLLSMRNLGVQRGPVRTLVAFNDPCPLR